MGKGKSWPRPAAHITTYYTLHCWTWWRRKSLIAVVVQYYWSCDWLGLLRRRWRRCRRQCDDMRRRLLMIISTIFIYNSSMIHIHKFVLANNFCISTSFMSFQKIDNNIIWKRSRRFFIWWTTTTWMDEQNVDNIQVFTPGCSKCKIRVVILCTLLHTPQIIINIAYHNKLTINYCKISIQNQPQKASMSQQINDPN